MKIAIVIPVYKHDWSDAIALLDIVTKKFPIVIISDGASLPDLKVYCQKYSQVYYYQGTRLKCLGCAGNWLSRLLEIGAFLNAELLLKIEPDTAIKTLPTDFPQDCDIFGYVSKYNFLFGGVVGFYRSAIQQILLSNLLNDKYFNNPIFYGYRWKTEILLSNDAILMGVAQKLNLAVKNWDKIYWQEGKIIFK